MNEEILKFPDGSYFQLRTHAYTVKKSQEEGEKDLEFFVKNSPCEIALFFKPETQIWYHPEQETSKGLNYQKETFYETKMSIDPEMLEGRILFYHTHPESIVQDVLKSGKVPKINPPERLEKDEQFQTLLDQEIVHAHICFPSLQDLITFTKFKETFKKISSLDAKIVSPKGRTTFKVPDNSVFKDYYDFYENLWNVLSRTGIQIEEKPEEIELYSPIVEICEEVSKTFQNKLELSFEQTSPNQVYKTTQ